MKWSEQGDQQWEQPPLGTHVARCVRVIDLGTQKKDYQGKISHKRECIIGWELPTELMQEGEQAGKPFLVTRFYTQSLGEKANLRKDLENWRNKPFTPEELAGFESRNILGKPCMVTLTEKNGKARVTTVTSIPKGVPIPPQVNTNLYFSLESSEFEQRTFDSLSDGVKEIIKRSPEYRAIFEPEHDVNHVHEEEPEEASVPF